MTVPLYPVLSGPLGAAFGGTAQDRRALERHRTPIRDRYGLAEYSGVYDPPSPEAPAIVFVRGGARLPTLGITAADFLPLLDPAEGDRVAMEWSERLDACRRATGRPALVVRVVDESAGDLAEEQRVLARCGITLARALQIAGGGHRA